MKDKSMLVAFMAVLAIGSGIGGYGLSSLNEPATQQAEPLVVPALFTGHLMVEVKDADGNIKAVREADNVITQTGENCALRALFQANSLSGTGSTVCTGAVSQPWNYIAVGTGQTQEVGTQQTLVTELAANGLTRAQANSVIWTNSTGAEGEPGQAAQIQLSRTFTVSGSPGTIYEAGLFNGTDDGTDSMFARKTFSGVSVGDGDSLTVQWTISIGNTTASVGS